MLHLSDNIRYIRLLSGKTQTEFAELVGATKDTLYTYEKGKAKPNELVLSKISKIAGVTLEQLLEKDLKKQEIRVIDPDTMEMVFNINTNTSNTDLQSKIISLEAEVKTLKEMIGMILQKK